MSDADVQAAQRRLQAVDAALQRLEGSLVELQRARRTLDDLASSDALIPIGGGVHVRAKLVDGDVVMPIGAGYAMDASPDAAKKSLDDRIAEIEQHMAAQNAEADRIVQSMQA